MLISLASPFPRTEREKKSRERRILEGLQVDWMHFPDGGRWPMLQLILQRMVADPPERRYENMAACAKVLSALARTVSPEDEARLMLAGLSRTAKAKEPPIEEPLFTAPSAWVRELREANIDTDVLPRRRVASGT